MLEAGYPCSRMYLQPRPLLLEPWGRYLTCALVSAEVHSNVHSDMQQERDQLATSTKEPLQGRTGRQ